MKIYFAASIRGGRENQEFNARLIEFLLKRTVVLTEHIGSAELMDEGEKDLSDTLIFERDIEMLEQADAVIAEVSTPSLGVGYELGRAEMLSKSVLCLFQKQSNKMLSAMLAGNNKFNIYYYTSLDDAQVAITDFLDLMVKK